MKKRSSSCNTSSTEGKLPCASCKNLYPKSSLYRHSNDCRKNTNQSYNRGRARSQGMQLLPKEFEVKDLVNKQIIRRRQNGAVKIWIDECNHPQQFRNLKSKCRRLGLRCSRTPKLVYSIANRKGNFRHGHPSPIAWIIDIWASA